MQTPVKKIADDLAVRAQEVINERHQPIDIMKSAFADFKNLGSIAGVMSVMSTGKLTPHQQMVAERIAVKVLAVLGMEKGAIPVETKFEVPTGALADNSESPKTIDAA